jgi:hypothetical protein
MKSQIFERIGSANINLARNMSLTALFLYVVWLYIPPYSAYFIGDDYVQFWRIREFVEAPLGSYRVFDPLWTDWYYRPLQNLWFLANRLVFLLNPFGYYYLQLIFHLLATALVFNLARKLQLTNFFAFLATLIFAAGGMHQLTVGWISSIGNIISAVLALAAIVSYLTYLQHPQKKHLLLLVTLFIISGFFSHELSIIVPIFIVALRFIWPQIKRLEILEAITFLSWLIFVVIYILAQITRPNANISASGLDKDLILSAFSPANQLGFILASIAHWFNFELSMLTEFQVLDLTVLELSLGILLFLILLLLLGMSRKANIALMFGALWMVFQLSFVYFSLWIQRPDILDNRHLFTAWMGLSFAVVGLFQYIATRNITRSLPFYRRSVLLSGSLIMITLFIFFQSRQISSDQAAIYNHALHLSGREKQLKEILPAVTNRTKLYANRFDLTAPYFAPTAAVWYSDPGLEGGSLAVLKESARITNETYLFDVDSSGLYNLMPELQEHSRSYLIWNKKPDALLWLYEESSGPLAKTSFVNERVVGQADNRRLAFGLKTIESGLVSARYDTIVPEGSSIAVAISGQPGQKFRLRINHAEYGEQVLLEHRIGQEESNTWLDQQISLDNYWGEDVSIFFDIENNDRGDIQFGHWSNPRFVLDLIDRD